jgi:uncharacterized membrane protein
VIDVASDLADPSFETATDPRLRRRRARVNPPWPYAFSLLAAAVFAIFFSWLTLQRYDAFLMHALDMGNMDQAVWNTLHGNLFHFTNMRAPLLKEAWGTETRLSFHIEPILLPLSLMYLVHAGPETLIVVQAIVVSLGAPAACRLSLRVTGSAAVAVAATTAYLLSPALQAATLYEFHAVTLVAPLLLWAIVFLEERRYPYFLLFAAAAVACKEEIGLIVAALVLWDWWRGGSRRFALTTAAVSAGWSLLAVGAIVPHFASGPSAYWQRYIDAKLQTGKNSSGIKGLLTFWFNHPEKPFLTILWEPKAAMLHRFLVSTGYLGVFALPMLLVSLPSLAIILLSTDQHMYGGLGQYSAELVPIGVAAGIYGIAWLQRLAIRFGWNARLVTAMLAAWLAVMAISNQRLNGFSPLASNYSPPAITAHDRLADRLLKLIPPSAAVSSMDQLNPHLGDREKAYLFPDVGDATYVALDLTTNVNPGTPTDQYRETQALLRSRHWQILAADDGIMILHRVATLLPAVPAPPTAFYTFAVGAANPAARPIARFGPDLELVGVQIVRREQVNLRVPDAIMVLSWRVRRPLPATTYLTELVTNIHGSIANRFYDRLTTAWLPMENWRPGQTIVTRSVQIGIVNIWSGTVSLRVEVRTSKKSGQVTRFTPTLVGGPGQSDYAIIGDTLQVARIGVSF